MVVVVLAVTSVVAVVPHYKWLTNAGLAFSSASLFASSSALSFFAAASSAALRFSISCADHRDAPPELELELDADADGERTIDRAGRTAAGRSARDCGFEAAGLATAFAPALAVLVPAIRRSIADGLVKDDDDDEEEKEEEEDG